MYQDVYDSQRLTETEHAKKSCSVNFFDLDSEREEERILHLKVQFQSPLYFLYVYFLKETQSPHKYPLWYFTLIWCREYSDKRKQHLVISGWLENPV